MFRISLREMLIFVAAIAPAIVSLRTGWYFWQGLIRLIAMLAMGMALIATIFDRGPRQAFAVGFTLVMFGYMLLVLNADKSGVSKENIELTTFQGQLPTSVRWLL